MGKENSTAIRVKMSDRELWKKYCKITGESSPRLFNKVMNSKKLELDRRMIEESLKKQEDIKRRFIR